MGWFWLILNSAFDVQPGGGNDVNTEMAKMTAVAGRGLSLRAGLFSAVALGIAVAAPAAYAGHQWNDYHWQIPTGGSNVVALAVAYCQGRLTWDGDIDATHGNWNVVISDADSHAPLPQLAVAQSARQLA